MSGTIFSQAAFAADHAAHQEARLVAARAGIHRGVAAMLHAARAVDPVSAIEGVVAFCVLGGAGMAVADIFGVAW